MSNPTQRERLDRVFADLRQRDIAPVLILGEAPATTEARIADYREHAVCHGEPYSWVGAHAAARWGDDGRLRYRGSNDPVPHLIFSFPLRRPDIAETLMKFLEASAFYAAWGQLSADGEITCSGTGADPVVLHLTEEDR